MMTKDEIKSMIAETIQTNNKKAITAQSLANVLTTMAENSGEGGGGLKFSEERTLYGINEEVLTDEQKVYNAETYRKMVDGEAVTINFGGMILNPCCVNEEDGFVGFEVSMTSDTFTIKILINLRSDGSVELLADYGVGDSLIIEYGNAESAKAAFAQPDFMYKDICIFPLGSGFCHCTVVSFIASDRVVLSCPLPTQNLMLIYNTETGEITDELVIDTVNVVGMVYINVSETNSFYSDTNKSAVSTEYGHEVFYAKDKDNSEFRYQSISTEQVLGEYLKITIYRNNTFETWQINADGTSTLTT